MTIRTMILGGAAALGLFGGPASTQPACEPLPGDAFTRACLLERERLAHVILQDRLATLCDDVGQQPAAFGTATWSAMEGTGRCVVSVAAPFGVRSDGTTAGRQGRARSEILGGSIVVGPGGMTTMELPAGFEDFATGNGLVVLEATGLEAALQGLLDGERAESAGILPQMLSFDHLELWGAAPEGDGMLAMDGAGPPVEGLDAGPAVEDVG